MTSLITNYQGPRIELFNNEALRLKVIQDSTGFLLIICQLSYRAMKSMKYKVHIGERWVCLSHFNSL